MSRDIAHPLASIVAAARKRLPQDTGATVRAEQRRNRPRRHVVLADVSSSMAEPAGRRRKIDILQDALATPAGSEIVAFGGGVTPLRAGQMLPEPSGSTPLHLALEHCAQICATDILVVSDGHPDDARAALAVADRLHARIDVIYCGPETDHAGIDFMRRLARGGGAARHSNMAQPQAVIEAVRALMIEGPK